MHFGRPSCRRRASGLRQKGLPAAMNSSAVDRQVIIRRSSATIFQTLVDGGVVIGKDNELI